MDHDERTAEMERRAFAVLHQALAVGNNDLVPLFSGGHDSLCSTHLCSRHPRFAGDVYHIDTGIGAKATREFVGGVCKAFGWNLKVYKSASTYEDFVRRSGFPGPGAHHWAYSRLKDRCVRQIMKGHRKGRVLATGCRKAESTRRMGTVEPVKIGEVVTRKGKKVVELKSRVWCAPCHDWTAEDQAFWMDEYDLPRNPLKDKLGMSGECFCGAFARPDEIKLIEAHAPDVAAEIRRLSLIAADCGTHHVWGTRPPKEKKGLAVVRSGDLCSGCDRRAAAAGVVFAPLES